jgi:primosomal protein N'
MDEYVSKEICSKKGHFLVQLNATRDGKFICRRCGIRMPPKEDIFTMWCHYCGNPYLIIEKGVEKCSKCGKNWRE